MAGIGPTIAPDFGDVEPSLLPTWYVIWVWSADISIGWNSVDTIGYEAPPEISGDIGPTLGSPSGGINPT